jgi:SsrA-binding protein
MSPKGDAEGQKTVVSNRRARHDYEILERYETGIVLTGAEVKSLRGGRGSLAEAYARVRGHEIWLEGMHIPPYEQAMDKARWEPIRPRKLLLHRKEIERLIGTTAEKGLALIPLRVYFAHGLAKVELGLARGRRQFEKRQAIAEREHKARDGPGVRPAALGGGRPPVYWSDNHIWGCTGFDLDENRSGEAGRGPRMPR